MWAAVAAWSIELRPAARNNGPRRSPNGRKSSRPSAASCKEASMNTSTHEPLEDMVAELIRRGLPADYARRAASELADHHRDLVEEMQAAGWTESYALSEASRRLGEPRKLVKNTVREYQNRYWCGRWPLLTFLLGPIPGLLVVWLITGLTLAGIGWILGLVIDEAMATAIESVAQYVVGYALKTWLTLVSPVLVMAVRSEDRCVGKV